MNAVASDCDSVRSDSPVGNAPTLFLATRSPSPSPSRSATPPPPLVIQGGAGPAGSPPLQSPAETQDEALQVGYDGPSDLYWIAPNNDGSKVEREHLRIAPNTRRREAGDVGSSNTRSTATQQQTWAKNLVSQWPDSTELQKGLAMTVADAMCNVDLDPTPLYVGNVPVLAGWRESATPQGRPIISLTIFALQPTFTQNKLLGGPVIGDSHVSSSSLAATLGLNMGWSDDDCNRKASAIWAGRSALPLILRLAPQEGLEFLSQIRLSSKWSKTGPGTEFNVSDFHPNFGMIWFSVLHCFSSVNSTWNVDKAFRKLQESKDNAFSVNIVLLPKGANSKPTKARMEAFADLCKVDTAGRTSTTKKWLNTKSSSAEFHVQPPYHQFITTLSAAATGFGMSAITCKQSAWKSIDRTRVLQVMNDRCTAANSAKTYAHRTLGNAFFDCVYHPDMRLRAVAKIGGPSSSSGGAKSKSKKQKRGQRSKFISYEAGDDCNDEACQSEEDVADYARDGFVCDDDEVEYMSDDDAKIVVGKRKRTKATPRASQVVVEDDDSDDSSSFDGGEEDEDEGDDAEEEDDDSDHSDELDEDETESSSSETDDGDAAEANDPGTPPRGMSRDAWAEHVAQANARYAPLPESRSASAVKRGKKKKNRGAASSNAHSSAVENVTDNSGDNTMPMPTAPPQDMESVIKRCIEMYGDNPPGRHHSTQLEDLWQYADERKSELDALVRPLHAEGKIKLTDECVASLNVPHTRRSDEVFHSIKTVLSLSTEVATAYDRELAISTQNVENGELYETRKELELTKRLLHEKTERLKQMTDLLSKREEQEQAFWAGLSAIQ